MTWTRFEDSYSGGNIKITMDGVDVEFIYIEAPEKEARAIFDRAFADHDVFSYGESCDCCTPDFHVETFETLDGATASERGCDGRYKAAYQALDEYIARKDVRVITAADIAKMGIR
jgi:hypothetical protein